MAINPMMIMELKNSWDRFTQNHPKFPKFWKAAYKNGLTEGTVIEFTITTPEGKEISSNLKLTKDDTELIHQLREVMF